MQRHLLIEFVAILKNQLHLSLVNNNSNERSEAMGIQGVKPRRYFVACASRRSDVTAVAVTSDLDFYTFQQIHPEFLYNA